MSSFQLGANFTVTCVAAAVNAKCACAELTTTYTTVVVIYFRAKVKIVTGLVTVLTLALKPIF